MVLRIGISATPASRQAIEYVVEAERMGVDSVWVPEFWGYDALTPVGALAVATSEIKLGTSIVQLGTRTPAMLAMSAMTLQSLSEGRFRLGIGTSGPQVIEGWHGVPFARPVQRTRETIDIIRLVTSGERLEYEGDIYHLPIPESEGRALRSAAPPVEVRIYVASLGPTNLRLTGELGDGWIGNSFLPENARAFFDEIATGATGAGRTLADIDLTVAVSCEFTDELEEAGRRHAAGYAFTFGAMGSATTNFYNSAFAKQGFGEDVAEVERLWRSGDRDGARARVPIEIGLGTNLLGTPNDVRARLRLYRDCGVATLRVNPQGETHTEQLDCLGQLLDLIAEVNAE